ncbi:RAMP superfamily CRISPR-associated protein [Sorangium sp. So ce296]|uniref:RAMP superfamily CRISPR-associated protein n=1 Tax=Sorangium sp. So ce296 TaxID=3133296 RepID=UPI003F5E28A6
MILRAELVVRLEGALLVGGYATAEGHLDATTAVDAAGVPVIPTSALRGALREACTRLARGEGAHACTLDAPCHGNCVVCALFGAPGSGTDAVLAGTSVEGGSPGRLMLGDARPGSSLKQPERALRVRYGVGIDRQRRAATPQVLFEREVLDVPGLELIAPVVAEGLQPEAWSLFERALPLVTGLGNSKSRGLGRVQVTLRSAALAASAPVHAFPANVPDGELGIVEIEALEPLVLGALSQTSNFLETLSFVPGSTLRGALGNAAARLGTGPEFHEIIVEPSTCLLFSDALPARRGDAALPVPVPRSSLACKHAERADHRARSSPAQGGLPMPRDGLLNLALVPHLLERHGGSVVSHRCPVPTCHGPLRGAQGQWPPVPLQRRVVTRLARDVYTGSALHGMLYTVTQIEAGSVFLGTVARLSARALDLLRRLSSVELRLGGGRSRGQGRIRLTIRAGGVGLGAAAVAARRKHYGEAIRDALPLLGERAGLKARGALAVLARTDLALAPERCPELLLKALYGPDAPRARCVAAAQGTGWRSGWSEGKNGAPAGPRPLMPVVAGGSAWLFVHERGVAPNDARLAQLEAEGIGALRELGLGRLVLDHELFCAG